jgi:hypothetical protein
VKTTLNYFNPSKMKIDELKKLDWQLLTGYAVISELANLKTIMENQAVIISALLKIPLEEVSKQMIEHNKENYKAIEDTIRNNIPDYPPLEGKEYKS